MHYLLKRSKRYRLIQTIKKIPNLIGYYPLSEVSGQTIKNYAPGSLGSNNQSVVQISILGTQGKIGRAASFNGNGDFLDLGSGYIGNGNISLFGLIKASNAGQGNGGRIIDSGLVIFFTSATNNTLRISRDGGTQAVSANLGVIFSTSQFVVGTSTSTGLSNLYINNSLSGSSNQSAGTPSTDTTDVFIGNKLSKDRAFNGLLQHIGIVKRILTTGEVLKLNHKAGFI